MLRPPTANGAVRTATFVPSPSQSRDSPLSAGAAPASGTTSHADSEAPLDTFLPISKLQIAERRVLSGIKPPDSVALNVRKKPTLVGLAADGVLPGTIIPPSESRPQKSLPAQSASAPPRSPRRQSRIPSTGSRALVMDVAQALQEAQVPPGAEALIETSITPQRAERLSPPTEKHKHKSTCDEYTAFVTPPLVEECAFPGKVVGPQSAVEVKGTSSDMELEQHGCTVPAPRDDLFVEISKCNHWSLCSTFEHEP